MKPLLGYLRDIGITLHEKPDHGTPGNLVQIIDRFRRYLTEERGVTSAVANQYVSQVRPFMEAYVSVSRDSAENFKGLGEADVIAFVAANCPEMGGGRASLFVTALRSLLTFLHLTGHIDRSMAASVPSVPGRRLTGVPKGVEPNVLEQLLASCDRNTRIGSRCFAVLTMLSRLGLRAGEVANLQLDDINWRSGVIVIVRAKGNRTEALPLPADVGEALADYISRWRPANAVGRTAFVRVQAPHGALTRGAVTQIVAHAAERCGFESFYAHRLRHTAATRMLRNGASLSEVGQVLRHRQMITTTIYAKADRKALRSIARAWPEDSRMSVLRQASTDYFAIRRALGFTLVRSEKLLAQFITYLEDHDEARITTATAVAWATLPQAGQTWSYARLSVVRRFAIYMQSIDPTTEVPPTHILVQKKGRATPFLYSQADLTALIIVTKALQSADRGLTLRTLILLLSVTGMRIGEAIRLDIDDFDPINGILTVRNTKFGKTRELPLHQTTVTALSSYLQRDGQPKRSSGTRALFLSTVGTRLDYNCMQQTFRRLVERAGLKRKSASCRPRLHDLRHTFAVETILDGYRDGNEPGNRIALLSTYLGHVDPASTYWYLSAAPELLALVSLRLERNLGGAA